MGQKQQLLWDLPASDSFLVNQAIYEIPDLEYRATMKEFTELLDLEGILKKQVRKLSLGERMKCEVAASLLHSPSESLRTGVWSSSFKSSNSVSSAIFSSKVIFGTS